MPPKKQPDKKKAKALEDKTFGLKNKNKSKKVQQYVSNVQATAKFAGMSLREAKEREAAKTARLEAKKAKEEAAIEHAKLFRQAPTKQHIPEGADPKSILCQFYKAGSCIRGTKCKFSHDLEKERATAKINVYEDPRSADSMDSWDQAKLEEVVKSKENRPPNETKIICRYFLDALENKKYGWFWECPNGNSTCKYKHALPPGYVLKSEQKKPVEDEEEGPSLEEGIEEERRKLDLSKCTPVTLESFKAWKEKKRKEKEDETEKKRKEAERKTGGRGLHVLSGRALFQYDPTLFVDDEEAAGDEDYEIREEADGPETSGAVDESLFAGDDELPDDE